jgi:betaine-aldehyde dehydrogenase
VVLDDADPDQAAEFIAAGIFCNAGQMCSATSRAILDESIADAVLERLIARARALTVGPGEDAEMGPITTAPQFARVAATLERARAEGLDCVAGGGRVETKGFFVQPTVYADVPADNRIWREEIFGPVLATHRVRTEAEAIAAANDTDYGLVATVVSGDPERGTRVAERLEAGHIWVNSTQVIPPQTAWGGFKASGIGRELGRFGLSAYLGVKHITVAA